MSKYVHIVLLAILALVCLGLSMAMVGAVFYGLYLAGVAFFSLPTYIWVSVIAALFVVGACDAYIDSRKNIEQGQILSTNGLHGDMAFIDDLRSSILFDEHNSSFSRV